MTSASRDSSRFVEPLRNFCSLIHLSSNYCSISFQNLYVLNCNYCLFKHAEQTSCSFLLYKLTLAVKPETSYKDKGKEKA